MRVSHGHNLNFGIEFAKNHDVGESLESNELRAMLVFWPTFGLFADLVDGML